MFTYLLISATLAWLAWHAAPSDALDATDIYDTELGAAFLVFWTWPLLALAAPLVCIGYAAWFIRQACSTGA